MGELQFTVTGVLPFAEINDDTELVWVNGRAFVNHTKHEQVASLHWARADKAEAALAALRAENQRLLDVETKLKGSIERRIKAVKTNPNNYYIDGHVEALELVLQWMNDPLRVALAQNPIAHEQGDKR